MKTLKFTLDKEWFDMILSGEKKEEYREIKQHWTSRLYVRKKENNDISYNEKKNFEFIEFRNGYGADKPFAIFEFKGLSKGKPKAKWSGQKFPKDKKDDDLYIIHIGKEISRHNI